MELYHLCNRGVEKRTVFLDDGDRARFVHGLFVFNDLHATANYIAHLRGTQSHSSQRELLVHIHAWCLMENHYHLLVSPADDDLTKLSLFAQKLGMGYSKFFNDKYARSGSLWQGKYRKIRVENNSHFLHVPHYIHLNPLDFSMPEWRTGGVKDTGKAFQTLKEYKWSSLLDYLGEKNFPSVVDTRLLKDSIGAPNSFKMRMKEIIGDGSLAANSLSFEM